MLMPQKPTHHLCEDASPFPSMTINILLSLPLSQAAGAEESPHDLHWEPSWYPLPQGTPSVYTVPLRRYLLIWCSPFPLLN